MARATSSHSKGGESRPSSSGVASSYSNDSAALAAKCICGHVFGEGAVFCRQCGASRPKASTARIPSLALGDPMNRSGSSWRPSSCSSSSLSTHSSSLFSSGGSHPSQSPRDRRDREVEETSPPYAPLADGSHAPKLEPLQLPASTQELSPEDATSPKKAASPETPAQTLELEAQPQAITPLKPAELSSSTARPPGASEPASPENSESPGASGPVHEVPAPPQQAPPDQSEEPADWKEKVKKLVSLPRPPPAPAMLLPPPSTTTDTSQQQDGNKKEQEAKPPAGVSAPPPPRPALAPPSKPPPGAVFSSPKHVERPGRDIEQGNSPKTPLGRPETPAPPPHMDDMRPETPAGPSAPEAQPAPTSPPPAVIDIPAEAPKALSEAVAPKPSGLRLPWGGRSASSRTSSKISAAPGAPSPRMARSPRNASPRFSGPKEGVKCSCGTVFADNSFFCRKCGKDRPKGTCNCGYVFLDDSPVCKQCGTERPKVTPRTGTPRNATPRVSSRRPSAENVESSGGRLPTQEPVKVESAAPDAEPLLQIDLGEPTTSPPPEVDTEKVELLAKDVPEAKDKPMSPSKLGFGLANRFRDRKLAASPPQVEAPAEATAEKPDDAQAVKEEAASPSKLTGVLAARLAERKLAASAAKADQEADKAADATESKGDSPSPSKLGGGLAARLAERKLAASLAKKKEQEKTDEPKPGDPAASADSEAAETTSTKASSFISGLGKAKSLGKPPSALSFIASLPKAPAAGKAPPEKPQASSFIASLPTTPAGPKTPSGASSFMSGLRTPEATPKAIGSPPDVEADVEAPPPADEPAAPAGLVPAPPPPTEPDGGKEAESRTIPERPTSPEPPLSPPRPASPPEGHRSGYAGSGIETPSLQESYREPYDETPLQSCPATPSSVATGRQKTSLRGPVTPTQGRYIPGQPQDSSRSISTVRTNRTNRTALGPAEEEWQGTRWTGMERSQEEIDRMAAAGVREDVVDEQERLRKQWHEKLAAETDWDKVPPSKTSLRPTGGKQPQTGASRLRSAAVSSSFSKGSASPSAASSAVPSPRGAAGPGPGFGPGPPLGAPGPPLGGPGPPLPGQKPPSPSHAGPQISRGANLLPGPSLPKGPGPALGMGPPLGGPPRGGPSFNPQGKSPFPGGRPPSWAFAAP